MQVYKLLCSTHVGEKPSHRQIDSFPTDNLDTAMSWMMSAMDHVVLRTLADSHLSIDRMLLQFEFPRLVKRSDLARAWMDAVHRLGEVVEILPEHLGVSAANGPSQSKPSRTT